MAQKFCLGIDIGASSVKLCQLKAQKGGYALMNFGVVPLPPETIVDGALMNSARVVEAIQELTRAHKIKNKQAAISVSGHSVIIKKIPLPQMSEAELDESIKWEAEQFIPFDIHDVNLDVQIVKEQSTQQGQMDVVLVAVKKDVVNEYTTVLLEAGLEPTVCDVDAFAVENMYEANYGVAAGQTVALVNIGASKTNINIVAGGVPCFTRDLSIGGNAFTEEIQKQMNVSFEEAEGFKIGGGGRKEEATDVVMPHDVERALQTVAESVTSEVQRSIDFYAATSADPPPSQIYLSGGTARLHALAKALEARINVPVHVADPFRQVQASTQDQDYLRTFGPAAGVAVGLALRYAGDS